MTALLTVKQTAKLLAASPATVYRRIHAGELKAVDIGAKTGKPRLRVEESALAAYVATRRVA